MSVKSEKTLFSSSKTNFCWLQVHHKSQIKVHSHGNPAQFCSIPAGVPRHLFPSARVPRNASYHPRGIPMGFPQSPSPCRSLLRTCRVAHRQACWWNCRWQSPSISSLETTPQNKTHTHSTMRMYVHSSTWWSFCVERPTCRYRPSEVQTAAEDLLFY